VKLKEKKKKIYTYRRTSRRLSKGFFSAVLSRACARPRVLSCAYARSRTGVRSLGRWQPGAKTIVVG
jgi:hypothetical protein